MQKVFFSLALQSVRRRKRERIFMSMVLVLSFSFAVIMLSVTESLNKTNEEYRFDTYGTWNAAIYDVDTAEVKQVQTEIASRTAKEAKKEAEIEASREALGISSRYGMINGTCGIGLIDEALIKMGRIQLQEGHFPQNADEIAVEADVLSSLGYNYEIGQKILLPIEVPAVFPAGENGSQENAVIVEKEYLLSGVLKAYTDLWANSSEKQEVLVGAMLNEKGAEELVKDVREEYPMVSISEPVSQLFFRISGADSTSMEAVYQFAKKIEKNIIINNYAYQSEAAANYIFYICMILCTTLVAVVCIYLLQMRQQIRQYALFRSLGITKRQLCFVLFYETLIVCVPALLIGCVTGGIGTWALMKMFMEVNTAKIYVKIPVALTGAVIAAWIAGIFAVRFLVFQLALRQPLSGRIQVNGRKAARYRKYQNVLCIFLASVFGGVLITGALQYHVVAFTKKSAEARWSYGISAISGNGTDLISDEMLTTIKQIPGVRDIDAWTVEKVDLTFWGIENCDLVKEIIKNDEITREGAVEGIGAFLYGIREEDWKEYLDFEACHIDEEAFRNGSQVVILFPVNMNNEVTAGDGQYSDVGIADGDKVTLHLYGAPYEKDEQGNVLRNAGKKEQIGLFETEVASVIRVVDDRYLDKLEYMSSHPYTILCSDTAFEKLFNRLPAGYETAFHNTEQTFGYSAGEIFTTREAGYLSTDYVLADYCEKNGIAMNSYREENAAYIQEAMQKMIQILSCMGGIVCISWLLLWNIRGLSNEKERKKYAVLRAVGMSKKQMKKIFRREALKAGVLAILNSWLIFGIYQFLYSFYHWYQLAEDVRMTTSIKEIFFSQIAFYGVTGIGAGLLILLTVSVGVIIEATYYFTRKTLYDQNLMENIRREV